HQLQPVALGIAEVDVVVLAAAIGHTERLEVGGRVVRRAALTQLEGGVLVAGLAARGPQLERVRLVAAGEIRAIHRSQLAALAEAELDAPAASGLVEVCHAQANVIDAAQRDHGSSLPSR